MNPVIASYGGGVNSTAMLVGMAEQGERVDLILFADTKGERTQTYEYIGRFNRWLESKGFPSIEVVGLAKGIEEDCLKRKTFPSIAFGFKTCSLRWKLEPQQKYLRKWQPAIDAWKTGEKVTKLIGYDAGEPNRAKDYSDDKYTVRYPLIEWGWGRDECVDAIKRVGLCVPPKSSCFFCPSMKKSEILQLRGEEPGLFDRAVKLEQTALSGLVTTIPGLGRGFSWEALGNADDDQRRLFPEVYQSEPCGCYDGE